MNEDPNDKIPAGGEILIYQSGDGQVKLDVQMVNESLWMTQTDLARLFQCSPDNISLHLKNIYAEGELQESATTEDFSVVRKEGKRAVRRTLTFYNLDAIISVGYRVKSLIATHFRIWATERLTEFIVKGFIMDDERLKNPPVKGSVIPDYFDEMLERIRDIRSSERRMYLRVRDLFAMAADYNPTWSETTRFFSIIQNKLHFAATGLTAAELIQSRAIHGKSNMGLTNWKGDIVRKTDITIAKNYLKEEEIDGLNRIVTMWLDFAEDQAKRRQQVFMKEWEQKLDDFLRFNEREVLTHSGTVSKKEADEHAKNEYEQFEIIRRTHNEKLAEKDYLSQLNDAARTLTDPNRNEENK